MTSKKLTEAAQSYAEAGIPIFGCNSDKSPQTKRGFKDATCEVSEWSAPMIGVPTGEIVCLDIDAKHKPGLVADFEFACDQIGLSDLLVRLPKQTTPSGGGCHYLFRPPEEVRNRKLAVNADKETIIETRGKGGYICVAPSKGYKFERGGLLSVPKITKRELEQLFHVARAFSEVAVKTKMEPGATPWQPKTTSGTRPGDQYNQRGDIVSLLKSHGWQSGNGIYWTRPGKKSGISATLGKVEGKFYVFSSNASPFEPETSYSPFAVYCILEHSGDFAAAGSALKEQGYGEPMEVEDVPQEFKDSIQAMIAREVEKQEYSWLKIDEEIQKSKEAAEQIREIADDEKFLQSLETLEASDDENVDSMRQRARDAVFVMPELALKGDSTLVNAAPNTGKTLITLWALCRRPEVDGQRVYYINADDSFNGSIEKMVITKNFGIKTLIPNERGFDPADFAKIAKAAIKSGAAHKIVFVLDTLKKFVDTMSKKDAREFNLVVRAFTQAGGTLIALAHTNKSKDSEGKSIAEGVGDFESDFDCAYTLEEVSGRHTTERHVMFTNRKNRGPNAQKFGLVYDDSEKKSWHHRFNSIEQINAKAIAEKQKAAQADDQWERDQNVIAYIVSQLEEGPQPESALIRNNLGDSAPPGSGSLKDREDVLRRYTTRNEVVERRLWGTSRNKAKRGLSYYLLSDADREKEGNLENLIR